MCDCGNANCGAEQFCELALSDAGLDRLALSARARRKTGSLPAVPTVPEEAAVEAPWQHRGNVSDSDDEGEDDEGDEHGFVLPPGWTSVRGQGNAFTWSDGTRSVSTITAAWEAHRAKTDAGAIAKQLEAEGLSVSALLDSLLLSDDEIVAELGAAAATAAAAAAAAAAAPGDAPPPPVAAPPPGAPPPQGAPPPLGASTAELQAALDAGVSLPEEEVRALLEDEDLMSQLGGLLDSIELDGVAEAVADAVGEVEELEDVCRPCPGGIPTGDADVDLRDLDE